MLKPTDDNQRRAAEITAKGMSEHREPVAEKLQLIFVLVAST